MDLKLPTVLIVFLINCGVFFWFIFFLLLLFNLINSALAQTCHRRTIWVRSCCYWHKLISLTLPPLLNRCPDTQRLSITSSWQSGYPPAHWGRGLQRDLVRIKHVWKYSLHLRPTRNLISLITSRGRRNLLLHTFLKGEIPYVGRHFCK